MNIYFMFIALDIPEATSRFGHTCTHIYTFDVACRATFVQMEEGLVIKICCVVKFI